MEELAKFQAKIKENERKLAEIEQRRKALAEESRKRKLEEEKERIKRHEEESVRKRRRQIGLSPPKCLVRTKDNITSMALVHRDLSSGGAKSEHGASLFAAVNQQQLLLCTGDEKGQLRVWDVLKSFSCEVTVEIKADSQLFALKHLVTTLRLPPKPPKSTRKAKGGKAAAAAKSTAKAAKGAKEPAIDRKPAAPPMPAPAPVEDRQGAHEASPSPVVVVGAGCDLYVVCAWNWSQIHCVEDAHENEIQAVEHVTVKGTGVLCTGSLDHSIRCWHAETFQCLAQLAAHTDAVLCFAVMPALPGDPGSMRLCSGADDCSIRVWDLAVCAGLDTKKPGAAAAGTHTGERKIEQAEHVLQEHDEFVGALCVVNCAGEDAPKGAGEAKPGPSFLVSASSDFSVRIWDRSWACVRVLEADKYVVRMGCFGSTLFAATRHGLDFDECSIEPYAVDPNPLRWKARGKGLKIMAPSTLIAEALTISKFVAPGEDGQKVPSSLFLMTAAEEDPAMSVYACPFKLKPEVAQFADDAEDDPAADGPAHALPTEPSRPAALPGPGAVVPGAAPAAAPRVSASTAQAQAPKAAGTASQALAGGAQVATAGGSNSSNSNSNSGGGAIACTPAKGDVLAKSFVRSILQMQDISPDMRRLLGVCLQLHE